MMQLSLYNGHSVTDWATPHLNIATCAWIILHLQTEVLAKEGVNLSALCIAENADFGILRGIVSEPDKAYKALKDNHFAVNVTDVVGISCPNIPGSLAKVLRCLSDEGVFIEYMYSFANGQTANVIIRPNDMENCIRVLTEKKVDLLAASDLYKL